MNVLIVKVSALGDVIHALPVLAYLKSADPAIQIDWLVEESFAGVLEGHPLLRKLHRIDTRRWRREGVSSSLRGVWQAIKTLRQEHYDIVLNLQGNAKSGLFTLLSGAPLRYGFDRDAIREKIGLLATNRKVTLTASEFHITDRSLAIARAAFPAGTDIRTAGPLPVDNAAAQKVEGRLVEEGVASQPAVVLHYGTTWVTKLWPLSSWQELAMRLTQEHELRPILTWGNDEERAAVQAIDDYCGQRCLVWPRGSLKELIALMARADLVVGGDTGPVHIAAAVETPTVSLFRVTDASRNAPRGTEHTAIQAPLDCSPCLRKECDLDAECGRSIRVDQVYDAIFSILDKKS